MKDNSSFKTKVGSPITIGELKQLLFKYDDSIEIEFRGNYCDEGNLEELSYEVEESVPTCFHYGCEHSHSKSKLWFVVDVGT